MKTLSIEEKAKAYDKAFGMAKALYAKGAPDSLYLEEMFPELKESDEKTREDIISFLKEGKPYHCPNSVKRQEWAAWLEKQGEHHIVCSEEQMKVLDEVLNFAANHESPYWNNYIFETLNNFIRQLYIVDDNDTLNDKDEEIRKALINIFTTHKDYEIFFGVSVENIIAWLEKQCEKNPTDNVEPKFQNGQWIVWQNKCYKVNYNGCGYELIDQNGLTTSLEYETVDGNAHLWVIQDAKDGDVLTTSEGAFIYNGNNGGGSCHGCYCGVNTLGRFKTDVKSHWTGKKVYPATKEEYDLLFQKMKEAGYEWDAEKKELNKIEPNYAWLEKKGKTALEAIDEEKVDNVNKVEPKFHEGDWVIQGCNILKIRYVGDGYYCFETVEEYVNNMLISELDSLYHLWTIKDAKDGDVLATDSWLYMFKYTNNKNLIQFHCNCPIKGKLYKWCALPDDCYLGIYVDANIHPATKKQRDLLFRKMKELGYEWDEVNKELRKINSYCEEHCKGYQETGRCFFDGGCQAKREAEKNISNHPKTCKDEQKFNDIYPIFRVGDYIRNKKTNNKVLIEQLDMATKAYWYVSHDCAAVNHSDFPFSQQDEWELIEQKVVEQPAWSEEDERLCTCLIKEQEESLDNVKNDKYGHSEIISDLKEMYNERIAWLKSIEERLKGE